MIAPDYQGGSIVNLMASIIRARGGGSDYAPLRLLPPAELAATANIVLLLVDGLRADWLARRSPHGILSRHLRGGNTAVFPLTTATAVTTFLTGDAPQQHRLTGWRGYGVMARLRVFIFAYATVMSFDILAQGGVDPSLIFPALNSEPLQQVGVDAKRDLPFDRSVESTSNGVGKVADFGNVVGIDFFVG